MKTSGRFLLVLFAVSVSSSVSLRALADVDTRALCRVSIHEERIELNDRKLSVELARSTLKAAEEIFVLADGLWKNQAIQRMSFLRYKYDRDAAKLGLERKQRLLERQVAVLEQVRLQCADFASGESSVDTRRALDEAYLKYREADCDSLELDVQLGKVETEFHVEMLESVHDLRANDVATRQDVIVAMRDLEIARKRMEHATPRAESCRRELAPAAD